VIETAFSDNFHRLLGLHRLTAKRAAELLEVSAPSLSYWLNGRREPDRDSLYHISIFFLVDPWDIMETSAHDFLSRYIADGERFHTVEKQIVDGLKVSELVRVATEVERGRTKTSSRSVGDEVVDLMEAMRASVEAGRRLRQTTKRKRPPGAPEKLRKLSPASDERDG
jgi:transcriptional regulator with XRE-family HTH domain